ncbi:MAG: fibronectin type III domain-containing protein, partial [Cocleimonas sp.]
MRKVIFIMIISFCSHTVEASDLRSDDFNSATSESNPDWRFYDPYDTDDISGNEPGESTLTFDGTNALINVPKGLPHDLWKTANSNKAPRLLQATSDTDFQFEIKFESKPKVTHQLQGIIIQENDNVFLRFDIFYNISGAHLFVAYIDVITDTVTTYKSIALPNSPNYRQVIRSGNNWTFRYSDDGEAWTDAVSFTKNLIVTEVGFFAGTTGGLSPEFLSSVDYFENPEDQPIDDSDVRIVPRLVRVSPPVISTWNGYAQPTVQFGQPGISQKWANILGNVFSDINLSTLTYVLNGEAKKRLYFGPNRRLARKGDFNIEIDYNDLNVGLNTIEIKAKDSRDQVSTKVVTINYTPGNYWPIPYTANWGTLTTIQDVENIAHIVDGLWRLTNDGIRTAQTGYDRTIAIGDETWPTDNYEVTVPFILHSDFSGIGFAVGWQGHEGRYSPGKEWPIQALAWIRKNNKTSFNIVTYGGLIDWEVYRASQEIAPLAVGEKYMLKSYSKPLSNGMSQFNVKFWKQSEGEPIAWNMHADVPTRDGSVLLVAHKADVTFGNVNIKQAGSSSPDTTSPVISDIQVAVTNSTATITWKTNENSDSVVNYGLNNGYGLNVNNSSQKITHSITMTGLSSNTTYHYQVKSADNSNNTVSSEDKVFTTTDNSTNSASGMVSDDFNRELNTNIWSFYDPKGDSVLSTTGTQTVISVPAGSNHDLWKNKLFAPRIRQAANNTD